MNALKVYLDDFPANLPNIKSVDDVEPANLYELMTAHDPDVLQQVSAGAVRTG